MDSLWPADIALVNMKAPVTVLKEQASLLSKQTKGIVVGEVSPIPSREANEPFSFAFHIKAPALGDYRFLLLRISYDVSMYPVRVIPDPSIVHEMEEFEEVRRFRGDNIRGLVVECEDELLDLLRRVFASSKTKQVVRAILAQSGIDVEPICAF